MRAVYLFPALATRANVTKIRIVKKAFFSPAPLNTQSAHTLNTQYNTRPYPLQTTEIPVINTYSTRFAYLSVLYSRVGAGAGAGAAGAASKILPGAGAA
jgi:hypothetical protein